MPADKPLSTGDAPDPAETTPVPPVWGAEDLAPPEDPDEEPDNQPQGQETQPPPEEPVSDPDAEPAQPAADEEPPPETTAPPAQPAGDEGGPSWTFDPGRYGLTDKHVVSQRLAGCGTAQEAFDVLAREHANLQSVFGRQSEELGQLRQSRTSPSSQGAPATAPQTSPDAGGQTPTPQQANGPFDGLSPDELQERIETDPLGVLQEHGDYVRQQTLAQVDQHLNQRLSAAENNLQTNVTLQQEFSAFTTQHPDWRQYWGEMEEVANDLGFFPAYEDTMQAAVLRQQDQAAYNDVLGLMAGGLPFDQAKEFHDLRQQKAQLSRNTQDQARANAAQRHERAATGAGDPSARGTATPAESEDAWGVEEMDPMGLVR